MRYMKYGLVFGLFGTLLPHQAVAWGEIADAIYHAAAAGRLSTIEYYLNRGYSIDTSDGHGVTALCRAQVSGNYAAYNLLLQYGANPYASCMVGAVNSATTIAPSINWSPYIIGAAVVGGGAAIAVAAGGGGGGGSSHSSSGGASGDNSGGSTEDNSGGYASNDTSSGNNKATDNYTPYTISDFRNDKEYTGGWFGGDRTATGQMVYSVNYHDPIHAAQAYAEFYGYDNSGKVVSKLSGTALVGVLDTGVNRTHREFKDENGNSIVTKWHNYDYGPCTASNNLNCWRQNSVIIGGVYELALYINGQKTEEREYLTAEGYDSWVNEYKTNYVYSETDATPSYASSHGSNVAGIIAANWHPNGYGAMGIAFTNTYIDAIRWDLKSSFVRPVQALLNDGALAVNMSLGTNSTPTVNASISKSQLQAYLDKDSYILDAARLTMDNYVKNDYDGTTDGMIWVLAAGNEAKSEPSIESGLKRLDGYGNMMMLTVVSVNVNSDGTYSLSEFSNKCGAASGWCIAAPGGNGNDTSPSISVLYNASNSDSYIGAAGTSQATPVVTGSIAFVKEAYPWMKSSQIIELLRTTASTKGVGYSSSSHSDSTYGAGLLNLGAAVMTYISDTATSGAITTASGTSVYSAPIVLDSTHLNTSSVFSQALLRALPETITVFDKYKRPFKISTAGYVSKTHASDKSLKNDVAHIAAPHRVKKQDKGAMTFSYSENANRGYSWMNAEYRSGKQTTGFYLSQDTRYGTDRGFARDLSNPFMSMTSAYGMTHQYEFNRFGSIKFEAVGGENALYDGDFEFGDSSFHKTAYALNSELQLKKDNQVAFGISSGLLYEDDAVLGMNGHGAFSISGGRTYTAGAKMSVFLTDRWTLTGSYYQGYTQAQRFDSNLLRTTRLMSNSFAVDSNYRWNKNIDFGMIISSPLRIERGSLQVNFPSGRDSYSDAVYRERYQASLKPKKREYKFALYLNNAVDEQLSWQTEFDVRVHPEHQNVDNDYRALFGLSYAFN